MRNSLAWLLASTILLSASAQILSPAEARRVIGKPAHVRGTVASLGQIPQGTGPLVLELAEGNASGGFRVIIPAAALAKFGPNPRPRLRDKAVTVSGVVTVFRDVPQIIVTDPAQLQIGGATDAAPPEPGGRPPATPRAGASPSPVRHASGFSESPPDPGKLPPNLLQNADFSAGDRGWKLDGGAKVTADPAGNPVLRVTLDPKRSLRIEQTVLSGIPPTAVQFQAFFRAQLTPGSSLIKPLTLRLGPTADEGSYLARPIPAPPGEWALLKWTRTSDLKGFSRLTFYIDIPPGEGELLIDDAYLFAHPDRKDKKTWKVSDG